MWHSDSTDVVTSATVVTIASARTSARVSRCSWLNTSEAEPMTAMEYRKPLPAITEQNRPYWESARAHGLRLQRCGACSRFRFPISAFCPYCLSDQTEWTLVSGRGTVYSFIIMHQ